MPLCVLSNRCNNFLSNMMHVSDYVWRIYGDRKGQENLLLSKGDVSVKPKTILACRNSPMGEEGDGRKRHLGLDSKNGFAVFRLTL